MSDFKHFFLDLSKIIILTVIVVSPILFFNIIVNPYKVFSFHYFKLGSEPNMRYLKTKFLHDNPAKFNSFLMGSSRINFLDPGEIESDKYYNLTSPGATPFQHYEDIKRMKKDGVEIKNLIIGLDFLSFAPSPKQKNTQLTLLDPPNTLSEKIEFFKKYIFLRPEYDFVKKTFNSKSIDYTSIHKNGTFYFPGTDNEIEQNISQHVKKEIFKNSSFRYIDYTNYTDALNVIDSIVEFGKNHNIKTTFFIHPTHHITYLDLDFEKYFEILTRLTEITGFYDFSGLNSIAIDNYNYHETSHYRKDVGKLIISKIFNQPSRKIPDDFGRYVNNKNINDQIYFHKSLLKDYFESTAIPDRLPNNLDLSSIIQSKTEPKYKIDKLNGIKITELNQPCVITTPWIKLNGWIIDQNPVDLTSKLYIQIGPRIFEANYDKKRNDRVDNNKNNVLPKLKWNIMIPALHLKKGIQQIRFLVVTNNKKFYTISDKCINIDVQSNNTISEIEELSKIETPDNITIDFLNGKRIINQNITITDTILRIKGWAIDNLNNSESGGVLATIQGRTYLSQFTQSRIDVGNFFNNPSFNNTGWAITIPCYNLTNGQYEMSFKVLNKQCTGIYKPSKKIIINYYNNFSNDALEEMIESNLKTKFSIDKINGKIVNIREAPIEISDMELIISGWAIDLPAGLPAGNVIVEINGKQFMASYGLSRKDVAKAFKNDIFGQTGWEIKIPTNSIGKGKKSVSLKIISNDNKSYFYVYDYFSFNIS